MARTGQLSGQVVVAENAVISNSSTLSGVTPTITEEMQGSVLIAASGTHTFQMDVANATLVHLKGFNNDTDVAIKFQTRMNIDNTSTATDHTETIPKCTEFLYVGDDTGAGIEGLSIVAEAGATTRIEYLIVG